MGKIFSAPQPPAAPTIVYTAAPAADPAPATTDTASTETDTTAPEVTADDKRLQDILTRRRGRLGTIATSFSGVLSSDASLTPARKTLLGE